MIDHQSVRMDLMTSKQAQEYLKTNDMVILPIGCFEMHGPTIPLGCDGFHAWAQAILLAEAWECVTLPPVFYTFPGASGPWPGTVDVSVRATMDYVQSIVEALLGNGFKRVVLCGTHGPAAFSMEAIVRDIFQKTGRIVIHIRPDVMPDDLMMEELGYLRGEDIMVLASLKILGLHGAYDPACSVERRGGRFESQSVLREMGAAMPRTFGRDYQHTGLRPGVKMEHADKAIAVMRKAVARVKDLPSAFAQYRNDMRELHESQPWNSEDVWTDTGAADSEG